MQSSFIHRLGSGETMGILRNLGPSVSSNWGGIERKERRAVLERHRRRDFVYRIARQRCVERGTHMSWSIEGESRKIKIDMKTFSNRERERWRKDFEVKHLHSVLW